MAAVSGNTGAVAFAAGYVTNAHEFSISYKEPALKTTAFGATADTFIGSGITEWSGSYTCRLDGTAPIVAPGVPAAATFTAATGRTYAGSIKVTDTAPSVGFDRVGVVTVAFQGTGVLTIV